MQTFEQPDPQFDGPKEKSMLLVIDDVPSNIETLYEICKGDYEICMATNGQQALDFCQTRQPHLILLDVEMPEMDGHEVCRRLKSDPLTVNIPVIFVTANSDPMKEARALDEGVKDFITKPFHATVVLARVRTQLILKYQTDLLRTLALTDGLTGVANRRHFDTTLQNEWRRCARARHPIALILIDVDFFKRYNDHYGHLAGDDCLQRIAALLKTMLNRSGDLIARYGGEEFVCILPNTSLEGAEQKAGEIERAVRALAIPHEKSDVAAQVVTISAGVAVTNPTKEGNPTDLLAYADRQLYAAKQGGRGQVQSSQVERKE